MRKMRRMRKIPRVNLRTPVDLVIEKAIADVAKSFVDDVRTLLERLHRMPCVVVKKRRRRRAAR